MGILGIVMLILNLFTAKYFWVPTFVYIQGMGFNIFTTNRPNDVDGLHYFGTS
jgi:hypothetical protein